MLKAISWTHKEKNLDTAKCLLNGSRVLLVTWRNAHRLSVSISNVCIRDEYLLTFWLQACAAGAASPARSTTRRRAWTSPASSARCWAAANPGWPPSCSGGKQGRNTGLMYEQWTQAWSYQIKADLIIITYPHQGDEIDDLVWSCYCAPCVQCQVMLLLSQCKSWLWSHFITNVDIIVDCCWGYCERTTLHYNHYNHNNNYNHQHDNTTAHNSRQHWSIRMTSTMTSWRLLRGLLLSLHPRPWFRPRPCPDFSFFLVACLTLCLSFTKSSLLLCKQIISWW